MFLLSTQTIRFLFGISDPIHHRQTPPSDSEESNPATRPPQIQPLNDTFEYPDQRRQYSTQEQHNPQHQQADQGGPNPDQEDEDEEEEGQGDHAPSFSSVPTTVIITTHSPSTIVEVISQNNGDLDGVADPTQQATAPHHHPPPHEWPSPSRVIEFGRDDLRGQQRPLEQRTRQPAALSGSGRQWIVPHQTFYTIKGAKTTMVHLLS